MIQVRVHTISLGCPKNQVDTEWMLGGFGSFFVNEATAEGADVVLINTCGFIEPAVSESLQVILDMARTLAELSPRPHLVVTGCLVSRYGQELGAELPEVDLFLEIGRQGELGQRLRELAAQRREARPELVTALDGYAPSRLLTTPPSYAYLKIAEGCDNRCRFCTIPSIRGPLVSRGEAEIIDDARRCLDQGRKELVLIAQDVTAYGRDRGQKALRGLLEKLAPLNGLEWMRLMYLYPGGLDRDLLGFLSELGKPFIPYFDIPLQHAHPDILASMGRPFRRDPRAVVEQVREFFPEAALRTTFIVGYPGETEEHFAALESFVRQTRFMHLGVFPYYPEDGSEAAVLPNQLPDEVKEERRDRIMELQAEISEELLAGFEGQELDVLVDRPHEEWPGLYEGRAWFQAPEVDGITYVSGEDVGPGRMVRAVIEEVKTYDLVALA
ncbi:MAG: 30S ribosomal protein S12 methylthiotransferase RimO [Desulfomicrobium sp.]|jgi:ribosomal protein S12 methylthiotransferase|nr:30S ribosomal protein S12 methylthiotransferase RimO [Pseudomonadota bacterium]MBV1712079.1 30S ribosomal protein S12 methylthiotransferase RimO [Desulfomicrobium sp.]MBU4572717.1 30S ribosomal protein S12 methylthiotransferase RimO [Pseudomonadota bacterium]MBU4594712.1 30S ribosomal protein S12 methylthiotransferase RimO [Pseudomonadota bacterium]MBV1718673.1 30S ribosomal protein S12 methylthiotransferase RimO [Desulfomicrobium sp.]